MKVKKLRKTPKRRWKKKNNLLLEDHEIVHEYHHKQLQGI